MKSAVLCGLLALAMGATIQDKLQLQAGVTTSTTPNILSPGGILPSDGILSPNGQCRFWIVNNLAVVTQNGDIVWSVQGTGLNEYARMRSDGDFVIGYTVYHDYIDFDSKTSGDTRNYLQILDNCNLVVYSSSKIPLWSSIPIPDKLPPGTNLGSLKSPNGQATLIMRADGTLALYQAGNVVWNVTSTSGAYATMQTDGNFVVYQSNGNAAWSTGTYGNNGAFLQVLNNTDVVVYSPGNLPLWSRLYGNLQNPVVPDKLSPPGIIWPGRFLSSVSGKTILAMRTDGKLALYNNWVEIWSAPGPYHPNAYATIQADGTFVVIDQTTNANVWSAGVTAGQWAYLQVLDNGKFVIINHNFQTVWTS